MANEDHQIRSAFTRGSIRGFIYVEGILDASLINLLGHTPGIIRTRQGISPRAISPPDWTRTLMMVDLNTVIKMDKWYRVRKGDYKGDVGLVVNLHSWGVDVLLVPRLKEPNLDSSLKRKRSKILPPPRLFDPTTFRRIYETVPKRQNNACYTCGGVVFEHGLIRKSYDCYSISSTALDIPSELLKFFQESGHPRIMASTFPNPQEWSFEEGERVVVRSTSVEGIILAVKADLLEIDLGASGTTAVPWYGVRKLMKVGDFVTVKNSGRTGWIVKIVEDILHIIGKQDDGEITATDTSSTIEPFETHINWATVIIVPFQYASPHQSQNDFLISREKVPWLETQVIIIRVGHAQKGYTGVVKDVLCGQNTCSGLKVVIQLSRVDFSSPFKTIVVDYDDIVEISTNKNLGEYVKLKASGKVFEPCINPQPQASTSGSATPMPHATSSSTPAWDPSSRTPGWAPLPDTTSVSPAPPLLTSPAASTSQTPAHVLLDARLNGVALKVNVNGGVYNNKDLVANVTDAYGSLSIRHTVYNKPMFLEPDWVLPKNPNAKRDNGLLVVIKGEHCGKYVLRIHHRSDSVMMLAVVTRAAGTANVLSGEQFDLPCDHLCVAHQTTEENKLNTSLMSSLRQKARGR